MNIKQFAGFAILALCFGCAAAPRTDAPSIDLATFKCPGWGWLPSEEVYQRTIKRKNLTVAVVSRAKEHKKFLWSMCIPDGHGLCDSISGHRGYTFGEVRFFENGQGAKKTSDFGVWFEMKMSPYSEEGFQFNPARRYLILVSRTDPDGKGYFILNTACELSDSQKF